MKKQEVIVIGAGVVGTTLAIQLAKQDYQVHLIERDWSMHHKIIGELLQPAGFSALQEMQLGHLVSEGIDAQEVYGYVMNKNQEQYAIQYDKKFKTPNGYGFRNGKFVQALREETKKYPNINQIQGNVVSLLENDQQIEGCVYQKEDKSKVELRSVITFVCEGSFSMFRNKLNQSKKKVTGYFLGIVLDSAHFEYGNYGNVIVSQKHPVVMYPISPSEHRVLIDFEKAPRIGDKLKEELRQNLLPDVPKNLKQAFSSAISKGEFQMMPNHRLSVEPIHKNGAMLIGDSLNMRHPLTGGGMTVGLRDVLHFTKQIEGKDLSNAEVWKVSLEKFHNERANYVSSINIMADALYKVVKDEQLSEAVYTYLKRGGKRSSEPLQLLSGASNNKTMLLRHFSAVAVWGARKNLNTFTWKKVKSSNKMMRNAVRVISPLLMNEKPSLFEKVAIRGYGIFDRNV